MQQGSLTPIGGISVVDGDAVEKNQTITVVLSDATGLLSASGTGVSGSGTKQLTISGDLSQVNSDLTSLKFQDFAPGGDSINIATNDGAGGSNMQSITVAVISPLAAQVVLAAATEHVALPATTTVAAFSDANTTYAAGAYTALVDWGDGTTSSGTVSGSNGTFVVSAGHTYPGPGSDPLSVTITRSDGIFLKQTGNVAVADDNIFAGFGRSIDATGYQPLNNVVVATFTDTDTLTSVSNLSATIDWGDGSALDHGTVSGSAGSFTVAGSHTYTALGTDTVKVTLSDNPPGTASATATGSATVSAVVGLYSWANPQASGDWTDPTKWLISGVATNYPPSAADPVTINALSSITINASGVAESKSLTVTGSVASQQTFAGTFVTGSLALSGSLTLKDDGRSYLEVGSLHDAAPGEIIVDTGATATGAGSLTAPVILDNGSLVVADGSSLSVAGALEGAGEVDIGNGSALTLTVAPNQPAPTVERIVFTSGRGELVLSAADLNGGVFAPVIEGFDASDVLSFGSLSFDHAYYDAATGLVSLWKGDLSTGVEVAQLTVKGFEPIRARHSRRSLTRAERRFSSSNMPLTPSACRRSRATPGIPETRLPGSQREAAETGSRRATGRTTRRAACMSRARRIASRSTSLATRRDRSCCLASSTAPALRIA